MKDLTELVFFGRGGQGAKTAADILAEAALERGKFIQAFSEYGPERQGAPVKAFTRISNKPIRLHCGITNPDVVIVIDPTLVKSENVTEGLDKNGILIVNTADSKESIQKHTKFKGKIYTVDATKISLEILGRNIPNTPILGAIVKITNLVSLAAIKEKIHHKLGHKLGEQIVNSNIKAVERAYQEVNP